MVENKKLYLKSIVYINVLVSLGEVSQGRQQFYAATSHPRWLHEIFASERVVDSIRAVCICAVLYLRMALLCVVLELVF